MNVEIMAVGTEILLGDIVNTNAQYLSKELALLEENAKKNKIGLWVDNNPIEPSVWRKY